MPKPMSMVVEVEEVAFGRVFRLLDAMPGVVSLNIRGNGPKAAPAPSRSKRGGAQTVPCIVLGALAKYGAGRNRDELRATLKEFGKAPSSLPDALQKLSKAKEIHRVGNGVNVVYRITLKGKKRFDTACQIQPQGGE